MDVILDLFGEPVRAPREGRGRPSHEWTLENSHKINLLFATGHSVKEAAQALRITQPTLRKHYFSEVAARDAAAVKMTAVQLLRLNKAADEGNVSAIKELQSRVQVGMLAKLQAKIEKRSKDVPTKAAALGKKEQAKVDAGRVGGHFGTRQPPAHLVN